MQKSYNPTWVTLSVLFFGVVFFLVFPVSIEITTNTSAAQPQSERSIPAHDMIMTSQQEQAAEPAQTDGNLVEYTLTTVIGGVPPMAFVGVGGDIDGVMNPELHAQVGDTIRITVINGDPVLHDLTIEGYDVSTGQLLEKDQTGIVEFEVTEPGEIVYFCSIPGHRQTGMEGKIIVAAAEGSTEAVAVPEAVGADIVRNPTDLPAPVGDRDRTEIRVDLTAVEVTGQLADGTTYDYFTFDGKVPGPMIRIRVGDTVELHLKNLDGSVFPHSIDLHAVTGPGGGAVFTQTNPGEETAFTFQALNPGVYVYHCATPSVAHHVASGMYGLIVVEPEGGLPPVDQEFYMMQGEIYSAEDFGTPGHLSFSMDRMLDEEAEYFVFNGAAMALASDQYALHANVGDTVRIFFGVGGPNATSSFHVIGEIFDRVYSQASITGEPLTDVQTTTVPPGGATMVEFTLDVPGRYILVDHALSRLERGLGGFLYAEGVDNPSVFYGEELTPGSGH
jgi:nitrite reductase (NO-forming)